MFWRIAFDTKRDIELHMIGSLIYKLLQTLILVNKFTNWNLLRTKMTGITESEWINQTDSTSSDIKMNKPVQNILFVFSKMLAAFESAVHED